MYSFPPPFIVYFHKAPILYIASFYLVYHACSSQKPCHGGGVCEAVGWIYQCNCTNTNHYGPNCETGRKFLNVNLLFHICQSVCR